jgi:hypothetical protein
MRRRFAGMVAVIRQHRTDVVILQPLAVGIESGVHDICAVVDDLAGRGGV